MRGELCIGFASFLSFAAMVLLIFTHIGQINTSTVPRGIYMARMNVSQYGNALNKALFDPIDDLYTSNSSAPLLEAQGLRQFYNFGLYSHCGYVNDTAGICSNETVGYPYKPYDYFVGDMVANYSIITSSVITGGSFRDSNYLGQSTKAAYWLILLGTILAAVSFLSGVAKHNLTFFLSAVFSAISSLFVLVGAVVWTVIIKKSDGVSTIIIGTDPTPIGIYITAGPGLFLTWAAFACLFVSMIPYLISCCTYRG
ncbi:actin cortical patch SUR7/pH-response regulator pali [Lentinula edodes]|nr:actin cortical patch SUR7/pH-response regulator pali [Lentinula edodes]